ncbi:hypothetical protein Q31b_40350 [Novipirellula aureliae]|uniref:Uncharacterized protein n=1 Tax=Novipirellula aureliae TaxID=2527966 RepID=A0A5C6DSP8_9BACT|nr:hypothetical protein Q31b_40350 [Novipirellula aureliae]
MSDDRLLRLGIDGAKIGWLVVFPPTQSRWGAFQGQRPIRLPKPAHQGLLKSNKPRLEAGISLPVA